MSDKIMTLLKKYDNIKAVIVFRQMKFSGFYSTQLMRQQDRYLDVTWN